MITQALSYRSVNRATPPRPRTGKGGLRPVDSIHLIDAAPPAREQAQRIHYFFGVSSNCLLGRAPVQPTLILYTMAYTDG